MDWEDGMSVEERMAKAGRKLLETLDRFLRVYKNVDSEITSTLALVVDFVMRQTELQGEEVNFSDGPSSEEIDLLLKKLGVDTSQIPDYRKRLPDVQELLVQGI